ncbi:MAG TPA: metallophosphoesterase [Abditibacterium sp.]|jgi:hypothetical protein
MGNPFLTCFLSTARSGRGKLRRVIDNSSFRATRMTRRALLRGAARLGVSGCAVGAGSLAWGRYVEPDWVEVEQIELTLPRLGRAFDGFRIAQISDIHIEGGEMQAHFPDICRKVCAQNADAIVITGDFITNLGDWQDAALLPGLRLLQAPLGVFAVLGNHDHSLTTGQPDRSANLVRRTLAQAQIRELQNEHTSWHRDGQSLHLCGLDDRYVMDLPKLLAKLPAAGAAILLQHQPDVADEVAQTKRFDLMLSGHSHGGQIALPFFGPMFLPFGARTYPCGFYQVGNLMLYTNRGLGTIDIPIRFCSRPEITVFTLRAGLK